MRELGPTRLRQRGNLLLGAIIAVLVLSVLMVGLVRTNIERAATNSGAAQGQTLLNINRALGQYITDSNNSLALQRNQSIPGVAQIYAPTIAELQALGYLIGNVNPVPANGGAYVTQVVLLPAGCVTTSCHIATRVWMTNPVIDVLTNKPDIKRLGALVSAVGGNGGFSDPQTPAVIRGSGWTLPNPVSGTPAGIVLAINGFNSTLDSNYVRMRDPRDPQLQGNLTAEGNIAARGNLTANGNVEAQGYLGLNGAATFNGACDTPGRIGKTSIGVLLICQDGRWQNVSGIDQVVVEGGACVAGQVGRTAAGILMSCQGGVFKNAAGLAASNITAGASCNLSGQLGLDPNSVAYLCRGGVWVSQANLNPSSVETQRVVAVDGTPTVGKAVCAAGGVSTYDFTPMSVSMDLTTAPPFSAVQYTAVDNGGSWMPRIVLVASNGASKSGNEFGMSGVFRTFCFYPS